MVRQRTGLALSFGGWSMSDISNIAASGMKAASIKAAVEATNIVNIRSGAAMPEPGKSYDGYVAQEAVFTSQPGSGVVAGVRPVTPAFVATPGAGGVAQAAPNVDLTSSILSLKTAETAYKASASLLDSEGEQDRTLLDTVA